MFRDNKREIFGFRKYKAYGLASAVIAAFFLMGGVASADEVTSATSSDTTAHVVSSPTEASADNATVASGEEVSANNTVVENTVANTETASTSSPYVSGEAKQSVRDNLAPLAEVQTSAPIAAQVYREDASDKAKLTDDDKIVEAESKEAFDKLPDAVRRRVKSVNIVKREDGNLGHTASVSGNVTLNAQYFHNDGKDVQTHIYKLVEKPVTPTPDPKKPETPSPRTPEPKKPETPQPEAPKPIETPKSNDSVVGSVDQPQFVKDELPKTGETNSNLALVGVSVLTALGLIGFVKRKREE